MSRRESRTATLADRWLLLIHQLPAKPAYVRVKTWRRLQKLGAVAVKNAVYALPASDQSQEDFAWLVKEIAAAGGEALICEARMVEGLTDAQVRALFDAARDSDYAALAKEIRALAGRLRGRLSASRRAAAMAELARFKERQAEIVAIDFFGAEGRQTVDGLIAGIDSELEEKAMPQHRKQPDPGKAGIDDLRGRVWVTRHGVHVDRISCAWLIRRFIDAGARFKFVPPRGYVPEPGELRFDMFEGEFTHDGDRCTFEVLLTRAGLNDPALTAIGEIIHDIDLKDAKFGRAEVDGIARLIEGLSIACRDDAQRIERGAAVFDDLYESLRARRS